MQSVFGNIPSSPINFFILNLEKSGFIKKNFFGIINSTLKKNCKLQNKEMYLAFNYTFISNSPAGP